MSVHPIRLLEALDVVTNRTVNTHHPLYLFAIIARSKECVDLGVFANTKNSLELTRRHIRVGSLIFFSQL